MKPQNSPQINITEKTIEFSLHDDFAAHVSFEGASHVSLAGSFNNWAQDVLLMEQDDEGVWKIEIPMLPKGTYHYKFFVDDKIWMEDIYNQYREPDGTTGFNSIFTI
ncbi:MAG: glycogen-binding domain-containing protein [Chitinophagaceae bacterium]